MNYSEYFWEFYYFVKEIAHNVLTQFVPLLFEPIKDLSDVLPDDSPLESALGWLFDLIGSTPFGTLTPASLFAGSMLSFVLIKSIVSFIKP